MNQRKIRDSLRLMGALLFSWLYLPHLAVYAIGGGKKRLINSDLDKIAYQSGFNSLPKLVLLLFMLHNNRYYRVLYYHRVGPFASVLMEWYRPGDNYFKIRSGMKVGEGMWIAHPYATVLNAVSIGKNFHCIHCTTLGSTSKGEPTIGNNVSLGANVTIIGPVTIGDNVTIGAGSVVVKDIPSNCVAVGNPCHVVKKL